MEYAKGALSILRGHTAAIEKIEKYTSGISEVEFGCRLDFFAFFPHPMVRFFLPGSYDDRVRKSFTAGKGGDEKNFPESAE